MEYSHSDRQNLNLGNAFKAGITLNIIFVVVEAIFGYLSNSMALVADAGHNFSDVMALAFSWIAVVLSQRQPTVKFTYGFRRSTILIAILNTLILLAAVAFIVWETISRLRHPAQIDPQSVIIVAGIGIVINGFTAWLFMKEKKHDLNIRSAFIHFLADALVSLGVVLTGSIIALTGQTWVDSVMSFIIIAVILYSTYHLLMDSVNLALDAVPENIDIHDIRNYLESLPEVESIHDLHVWAMSTTEAALTVHLTTHLPTDSAFIGAVQQDLHKQFDIEHSTIQVEYGSNHADGAHHDDILSR